MYSSRALFFLYSFNCFLVPFFTPQIAVPTASPRRQRQPCNWRHHVTWLHKVLSIVTMRLSSTVMEMWRLKNNGGTSLTFCGYVTSSVTWPFDSRGSTSYRWSIVTMCLSSTVMEIWPFEFLPGRLFQEQRLVVCRSSVGRSVLNITLILYTLLRYIKNVARDE